jgi:hypothetical protein
MHYVAILIQVPQGQYVPRETSPAEPALSLSNGDG